MVNLKPQRYRHRRYALFAPMLLPLPLLPQLLLLPLLPLLPPLPPSLVPLLVLLLSFCPSFSLLVRFLPPRPSLVFLPLMLPMLLLPSLLLPLVLSPLLPQLPLLSPCSRLLLTVVVSQGLRVWDEYPVGFLPVPPLLRRRCLLPALSDAAVFAGLARMVLWKRRHHVEGPCPSPEVST
jgi:hypothetical protein